MSDAPTTILEALLHFQAACDNVPKGSAGQVGSRTYAYADLADVVAHIRKPMAEAGLVWASSIAWSEGEAAGRPQAVVVSVTHAATGDSVELAWPLFPADSQQRMGSQVTYARRYGLMALLGLVAEGEDDDGAKAQPEDGSRFEQRQAAKGRGRQEEQDTSPKPPTAEAVESSRAAALADGWWDGANRLSRDERGSRSWRELYELAKGDAEKRGAIVRLLEWAAENIRQDDVRFHQAEQVRGWIAKLPEPDPEPDPEPEPPAEEENQDAPDAPDWGSPDGEPAPGQADPGGDFWVDPDTGDVIDRRTGELAEDPLTGEPMKGDA